MSTHSDNKPGTFVECLHNQIHFLDNQNECVNPQAHASRKPDKMSTCVDV